MTLRTQAVLTYIALAEAFEHERLLVLSWNHDAFRRILADNKAERPYLRAARHAAAKGLDEFLAVVYLHDRDRRRHAHAAAVLIRADGERYHALRLTKRKLQGSLAA